MKLHALLLAAITCLAGATDSRVHEDMDTIDTTIEAAYRAYVQDFIENDFEGIADRFRLPAVFEADTATIFHTRSDLIQFFKDAKANIQEGYAYSIVDSIEIRRITEQIYSADVVYRRFDANDAVIHQGRSVYLYKNVGKAWKIFLLSPYSNE